MNIIVCLDENNGMCFNNRRQSTDCILRERILDIAETKKLWMNGYSARQFSGEESKIHVDEQFLTYAGDDDYCFVENVEVSHHISKIKTLIIYRWNRTYPSDVKFPIALFDKCWKLTKRVEFSGNSHNKITEETYIL